MALKEVRPQFDSEYPDKKNSPSGCFLFVGIRKQTALLSSRIESHSDVYERGGVESTYDLKKSDE